MPKMSIKKKHPTNANASNASNATANPNPHHSGSNPTASTATSIVHSNAANSQITRKRLFQFLFKNYIKSAYSGSRGSREHLPTAPPSLGSPAAGPSAAAAKREGPHRSPLTDCNVAYGASVPAAAQASKPRPTSVPAAATPAHQSSASAHAVPGPSTGAATTAATTTPTAAATTATVYPAGPSGSYRAAVAMRKRELRTEYFNDMSECYTHSQRLRRAAVNAATASGGGASSGQLTVVTKRLKQQPSVVRRSSGTANVAVAAAVASSTSESDSEQPVAAAVATTIIAAPLAARPPAEGGLLRQATVRQLRQLPGQAPHAQTTTPRVQLQAAPTRGATSTATPAMTPLTSAVGASAASSRAMTVTQLMDRQITQNDDIGWGKKVSVTLVREPTTSFGVCIVGGKVNISKNLQVAGIFIKNIVPNSPAETCKQIKIGDRILSVNQLDVRNATQEETIGLIKNAGCRIELVLQSFDGSNLPDAGQGAAPLKSAIKSDGARNRSVKINSTSSGSRSETPDTALSNNNNNASEPAQQNQQPQNRVNTSGSDSSSSDDDAEETSGKVSSKAGYEIDRKSAGNLKRSKEEAAADPEKENNFGYTDQKLKKKYGPLGGKIIRANIQRDDGSLGLALAGHRDRCKMGCFVAGINPKGSASSQNVKVGDELLEISGVFLHRMCHLNASVIIKGIPGIALEFILLRVDNAVDEMAVKPVISFPTAFDQFDQLYSCFKNVRNVTIQKVGTSLGIMIIEGKHSEVGQGIFISDIQENSNAENAGVKIGEMVLAVNKDLLIDTNYDTAAGLLKRAEGIVTLTLCNPNKKEGEPDGKPDEVAGAGGDKAEAKKPEKPAEPEAPKDPATTPIEVNKDTLIEITAEKKPLGVVVVKGDSSAVQSGASVIVIHANGAVHKDNRLKVFDKITEIDGKKLSSETSDHDLNKIFQTLYHKVKMTVYRAEPPDLKEMEVEITKKGGKDIGLSFAECKDNGIYVLDIATGSEVDKDKRMIRGDIVTHINGDDIRKCNFIESTILLRAAQPKCTFKVVRPKGKK